MQKEYKRWTITFCSSCKKEILEQLKESLRLSVSIGRCDVFGHSHTGPRSDSCNELWSAKERYCMKFTNDTRRKLLRCIKESNI